MKKLKMFTSLIQPRNIDYLKLKSLTINIDGWSVELVETGNKDYCNEKIAIFVPAVVIKIHYQ